MKKKTNIQLASRDACTGCAACASVCPTSSITMREDKEGFLQPHIDTDTCINSHKCEKTCPIVSPITIPTDFETQAYAAINKDEAVRMRSSSGGVFYALAKRTIEQGGVVFGARFNEQWEVVHDYTETIEGIEPFMRSKYVQSRIGDTFKQAKQFLDQGRWVLYSGTPCQIGGLKSYLHKDYDKLLTVDLICHGVPSPSLWMRSVKETVKDDVLSFVNFRDKKKGWRGIRLNSLSPMDKSVNLQYYSDGFLDNYYLRMCCYKCRFKTIHRAADVTLADAWGIENYLPEIDDNKGTSLVLAHSLKGRDLLLNQEKNLSILNVDIKDALKYNKRATTSVKLTTYRRLFFLMSNYLSISLSVRILRKIDKYKNKMIKKLKRLF